MAATNAMNRRGFFKALAGVALVAATPIKFISAPLHARIVRSLSYSELVTTTLRNHQAEIIANLTHSNSLLRELMKRNQRP